VDSIVYSSPYVPVEWIAAHGLMPVRLVPRREAGREGPVRPLEGVCPFMRLFVNAAATRPDASGIVLTTVCDQMRHAKDILDRRTKTPSFLLNVPPLWQTASAHALYLSEIKRLGRFLESVGGRAPSHARLIEVMDDYDQLRTNQNPAAPAGRAPRDGNGRAKPIALLGGPLTLDDQDILTIVTDCGGTIVLDGTEGGERTRPAPFDRRRLKDDPLGELAAAYYSFPDVFLRPNSELFKWIKHNVASRGIRGVILTRQMWCDKWHAEVHRLREWLRIPLLDLDLDGEPCDARTRTRIQAFMESIA
jgi:benzoyl-CoA reductase/2-hydroxyglutaryl-CoA dehydratase subunit BcrC/BadD/HgdB